MLGRTSPTGSRVWLTAIPLALAACGGGGADGSITVPPVTPPVLSLQRVYPQLSFVAPLELLQALADATRWYVL